jgi:predicted PurR-regulated permease PerM
MPMPDDSSAPAGTWLRSGGSEMSPGQKRASLIAALLLILAALFTLREFLPALAWTVVFAIALWPLFHRLGQRWPSHRRALLPALFVAGVVVIFVLPVVVIAVPLASDAHAAAQWVQQVRQNGIAPPAFLMRLPHGAQLTSLWDDELGEPAQISVLTKGAISHGGGAKVAGFIGRQTVHRLVLFGFMLLGLFFFLRDSEGVIHQLKVGSRRAFGHAGEDIAQQIISSVHGTVNGLVLVGLGEGVVLGLAYFIAGVPHPTLIGLLTAILAMIPFGAAIAIGIAALTLLAQGKIVAGIIIVVLGVIVVFVADHFIRPVLIGGATRLPFIWVLLGILGGVTAWGLVGLFVGPAIMAALILVWREWIGAEKGPINPDSFDVHDIQ